MPTPDPSPTSSQPPRRGLLAIIGPGVLVAATGVGAGDLATAGFSGATLGLGVAWAIVFGAVLKYILSENLARWQLGTGETVLEGAIHRLGWPVSAAFVIYLIPWSVFVGTALTKACGVTLLAIFPYAFMGAPLDPTVCWGVICSLLGAGLVWAGGFRLFERIMAACVVIMVLVTVFAAIVAGPDLGDLVRGLLIPRIPEGAAGTDPGAPLRWTIALLGGVGGTLTLIAYSYWMVEADRRDPSELRTCRLDLASGYAMTALFGIAMLIVATGVTVSGRGVGLVVDLAGEVGASFAAAFGPGAREVGRIAFLVGAFAAVFSSLLGVWQVVPLIFADWWGEQRRAIAGDGARPRGSEPTVSERAVPARCFLVWITLASLPGLQYSFAGVQMWYGYIGACFIPGLAIVLLILNRGRRSPLPVKMRNGPLQTTILAIATLVLLAFAGWDIAGRAGLV